jgi:ABC-2 type transport system ATP-binding protein
MRQRLALATAMLGDPRVLILDEPANGLDPEGIAWLRGFLRHLASQGRTVLVSSHLLSEVEQTVDRVVIVARGRLVRQGTLEELAAGHGETVVVRSPGVDALAEALTGAGAQWTRSGADELRVTGLAAAAVGHHAFTTGVEVHELRTERYDLEQIFFQLTAGPAPGVPGMPGPVGPAAGYPGVPPQPVPAMPQGALPPQQPAWGPQPPGPPPYQPQQPAQSVPGQGQEWGNVQQQGGTQ